MTRAQPLCPWCNGPVETEGDFCATCEGNLGVNLYRDGGPSPIAQLRDAHYSRVTELLETANRYLQRARDAEAALKAPRRVKLDGRRRAEVVDFVHRLPGGFSQRMTGTLGFFDDGRVAEIFIDPPKLSNDASNLARDVAMLISIALQHGVPVEEIRAAVGRAEDGTPHSIAGSALDLIAREQGR